MNFDDYAPTPDKGSIEVLVEKAKEATELESLITDLEDQLKQVKERLRSLTEQEMVSIMADLGLSDFTLDSGEKLVVSEFYSGSLNRAPDKQAALDWIHEHGGTDLIKTGVNLTFGKSEHNMALSLIESLKEQGYDPTVDEGVHPQTLAAFAREKNQEYYEALGNGETLEEPPLETLGIYHGRKVKIKAGKK